MQRIILLLWDGGEHKRLGSALRSHTCELEPRLLAIILDTLGDVSPSEHEETSCWCRRARLSVNAHAVHRRRNSTVPLCLLDGILNKRKTQIHGHRWSLWSTQRGGRRWGIASFTRSWGWERPAASSFFGLVEMKTTCTAWELGKSVQTFMIYKLAVQRQTAWNPLRGEIPAPFGSRLAEAFSTDTKRRKKITFISN